MTLLKANRPSINLDTVQRLFVAQAAALNLSSEAILRVNLDLLPVGKPTMTQRSKWTDRNQAYLTGYCQTLRLGFNRTTKFETCQAIQVIALFPTDDPKLLGQIKTTKPDASNILKGVEDALIRLDQRIGLADCLKIYAPNAGLIITLINAQAE